MNSACNSPAILCFCVLSVIPHAQGRKEGRKEGKEGKKRGKEKTGNGQGWVDGMQGERSKTKVPPTTPAQSKLSQPKGKKIQGQIFADWTCLAHTLIKWLFVLFGVCMCVVCVRNNKHNARWIVGNKGAK